MGEGAAFPRRVKAGEGVIPPGYVLFAKEMCIKLLRPYGFEINVKYVEKKAVNLAAELLAEVQRLKQELENLKRENQVLSQLICGK